MLKVRRDLVVSKLFRTFAVEISNSADNNFKSKHYETYTENNNIHQEAIKYNK